MSRTLQAKLRELKRWARQDSQHANVRLRLLHDVEEHLSCIACRDDSTHETLSNKLERWRYSVLRHDVSNDLSRSDCLDTLETFANQLSSRQVPAPRRTYAATFSNEPVVPALMRTDLLDLSQQITHRWFSENSLKYPDSDWQRNTEFDQDLGRREMLLYAPLYLSNYCTNHCTYCGFRYSEPIPRTHLSKEAAIKQARLLYDRGIRNILLVAGDYPKLTSVEYFADIARELNEQGFDVSIEIAPLSTNGYAKLVAAGVRGVTLYQETYDEERYVQYHPRGSKSSFHWRLEALDRAVEAGFQFVAMGVLLGLGEPTSEYSALTRHGWYLQQRFPNLRLSFGLPRIHEAPDDFEIPFRVDDATLKSIYAALRVAFPLAHLVLSTRESVSLRNELAHSCITQMSAGSCTAPGGYEDTTVNQEGEQFPVHDQRTVHEVATWLSDNDFSVVWRQG